MNERRLRELAAVWAGGTLATGVGLVLGAAVVRLVAGPDASGWWPVFWIAAIGMTVAFVAGLVSESTITWWASRTNLAPAADSPHDSR